MTDIPERFRPFHVTDDRPDTDTSREHYAKGHTPVYRHKHGVLWRAPWQERYDSTGIAARLHLRALDSVGVPIRAVPSSGFVGPSREVALNDVLGQEILSEVGHLREPSIDRHVVEVDQLVPSLERVRLCLYGRSPMLSAAQETRAKSRVLFTVWERDSVSVQMADVLKKFGQHWVPCERNAFILREAGIGNVHVVPHPFDPASPLPLLGARKEDPKGDVLFYTIAKWEPRKALHELLGAFLAEFRPDDAAVFGLKTNADGESVWDNYPKGPVASLRHWLAQPAVKANGWSPENVGNSIRIVTSRLSDAEMYRLHAAGHVYVSASHGEGFDFPAFDAMVARSRLVHVGFGGSEDYVPRDALVVMRGRTGLMDTVSLEPVHPGYKWSGAKWAELDVGLLRKGLRRAYEEKRVARDPVDLSRWSFATVGGLMRDLLRKLAHDTGVEVGW